MTFKQIPFFNYPALFAEQEAEFMAVIRDVCGRGAYIMQRDLESFESNLALYLGAKHAIGLADGTMALLLGMIACGVEEGDEVIVPSHTFVASASAIVHTGARPVLADCGPDHQIDPTSVGKLITPRTKAIMPVQLNGRMADMNAIEAIAKQHGLMIVEDSCQSLGAKFDNRFAGTIGRFGAFSHFPAKTLGCFGDGGSLVTNDDDLAAKVRQLRDHGRGSDGKVSIWGFNARLDNLQAAILDFKLASYDQAIARRRTLAGIYDRRLANLSEVLLPPGPASDPRHFDIFQNYEIEADRRDELRAWLDLQGVKTILQWGGHPIHQHTDLGLKSDCPYTEVMTSRFLLLPMNTALSDDDVNYICDCIAAFYGQV